MNIEEVTCKTALSASKLPGLDYSLNPYVGCMHQCRYCYAPSILRMPIQSWKNTVKIKRNIPTILAKELKSKKKGVVGISTVTDPYQPIEKKAQLTRYCLQVLLKKDTPISIQTKSDLILKDAELITQFSNAEVMVSIGTLHDEQRKLLEPGSSSIQQRIKVLNHFAQSSVKTSVFFGPIYPTMTLKDIESFATICKKSGIDEVMIDRFHIKPGIINNIQDALKNKQKIAPLFSQKELSNQSYYQKIREKIRDELKHSSIICTDAF